MVLKEVATCPHWLGPLDETRVEDGCITCPWHGYRFDLRTGRGQGAGRRYRLAPAQVEVDAAGAARLLVIGRRTERA